MASLRSTVALALAGWVLSIGAARAGDPPAEPADPPADHAGAEPAADPAPTPAPPEPAAAPEPPHAAPEPAAPEPAAPEPAAPAAAEFDADGDGTVEPEEQALEREFHAAFAGAPAEVSDAELDQRPAGHQLVPSLTAAQLRAMVKVARAKVLDRMEAKMARTAATRMERVAGFIRWFSLAGLLLLALPLVLRRRYPGQGRALVRYSALAAVTFVVTVNLFGTVVLGFRTAQGALGAVTNPQLRIAAGFFDSLDRNADDYLVMGKELFAPTLAQLEASSDEQPAAILIENGTRIVQDAQVFLTVARAFKRLDVVFAALPIVILIVTMILFVLAIRPTLLEIIRLPIEAAAGRAGVGRAVVGGALRRVGGELIATAATLGVLIAITLLSGAILGRVVAPALDALIEYFQLGISYLQFVAGASSARVFAMLFGVIAFLVLNLAAVIASMSLYLGKAQKIFQRRCNDGVPLATHRRFWIRGTAALLAAQLIPLGYLLLAGWGLDQINTRLTDGITDASQVSWQAIMLAGPGFLVGGFVLVFWAARGFKALAFLARYQVREAGAARG